MQFCYILSGWEGSATDGRIFDDACRKDFAIPSGSYYLADTGFMTCNALLIPYCGTCYHLKEWGRAPQKYCFFFLKIFTINFSFDRPRNYKELYNLRHSQARNVIERIFGVVKRRFRLMVAAPEYPVQTQAKLVPALCVLHNFIRTHDPEDLDLVDSAEVECRSPQRQPQDFRVTVDAAERREANDRRDKIAQAMWTQYIEYNEA